MGIEVRETHSVEEALTLATETDFSIALERPTIPVPAAKRSLVSTKRVVPPLNATQSTNPYGPYGTRWIT